MGEGLVVPAGRLRLEPSASWQRRRPSGRSPSKEDQRAFVAGGDHRPGRAAPRGAFPERERGDRPEMAHLTMRLARAITEGDGGWVRESDLIRTTDGGLWIESNAVASDDEPEAGRGGAYLVKRGGRWVARVRMAGAWAVRPAPHLDDLPHWIRVHPADTARV